MTNRELDRLVAEKVMGWKVTRRFGNPFLQDDENWQAVDDGATTVSIPRFTDDIQEAWQVVERVCNCTAYFELEGNGLDCWYAFFTKGRNKFRGEGETVGEAICKAALEMIKDKND